MDKSSLGFKGFVKLAASIILCQLAGVVGSIFTISSIPTWYAGLRKPFFSPPNWVFGPVWITLYLMMGISLYLIWKRGLAEKAVRDGVLTFAVQLILNSVWSIAFFGLKSPIAGLTVIILLWLAIALTIQKFWRISKTASVLLIPYLLWVSFATILNASILILNP